MKRLAMVEAAAGRGRAEQAAISSMKAHYLRALERRRQTGSAEAFYPAINLIVAELALGAGRPGWKGVDKGLFAQVREGLAAKEKDGPDFWSVVGRTEVGFFEAVARGELAAQQRAILAGYRDLAARVKAGSKWGSVYDTASFVLSKYLANVSGTRKTREAAAASTILGFLKKQAAPTAGA
jgi:hypothetical protein